MDVCVLGDGCLVVRLAKWPWASILTYVTLTSLSNACKKDGSHRAIQNHIQQKPKKEGKGYAGAKFLNLEESLKTFKLSQLIKQDKIVSA